MDRAPFPPPLTAEEGRALLRLARGTIVAALGAAQAPPADPPPSLFALRHPVFVTLRVGGRLRGCIGRLEADATLADSVPQCARAAAFEDPRFAPLASAEVAGLSVEVSVLGEARSVQGPGEIALGDDGLIVSSGSRRGLLLPHVAPEQGWDVVRFIEETCRKAGLGASAWREGARLEAFRAAVFREP